MTVAEWCVFGTVMLYLLTIVPIKWIGFRRYDNARPRDPAFYDEPLHARALEVKQLRSAGQPTVPSLLAQERATNPFLRVKTVAKLAEIRSAKDNF